MSDVLNCYLHFCQSSSVISKQQKTSDGADCLNCGHRFTKKETAAMAACKDEHDLCVIDCSACGAHNIVRAEPQGAFDEQPELVVLRISAQKPDVAEVFDEGVEPGTYVHPITRGKSN